MQNPFRDFNSSPEIIRLTVMMYVRYPLSLRQVEDILFERGIDICHETARFCDELPDVLGAPDGHPRGQLHGLGRLAGGNPAPPG